MTGIDGAILTIAVPVGSSSCNRFDRLDIEERDEGPFETVCTGDLRVEAVTATLDEPLGDRDLLGCAPGPEGLQDYFDDLRQGDDCAEIIPG